MIRCILIDDEKNALEMMEWLIKTYCPSVEIAAMCSSAEQGIEAIHKLKPDVVFLDIEMPEQSGFDLIRQLQPEQCPAIVFVTAFHQHAVKAFEVRAIDYLGFWLGKSGKSRLDSCFLG